MLDRKNQGKGAKQIRMVHEGERNKQTMATLNVILVVS